MVGTALLITCSAAAEVGGAGDMAVEDEAVEAAEGGEGDDAAPMDT